MHSPQRSPLVSLLAFFICMAAMCLGARNLHGFTLSDFSPEKNNRFESGFNTESPVANTSGTFVAAGYDLSGWGWDPSTTGSSPYRARGFTAITPRHVYGAWHFPAEFDESGKLPLRFANSSNGSIEIPLVTFQQATIPGPPHDVGIGTLSRSITTSEEINVLPILDISSCNYVGQPAFLTGSDGGAPGILPDLRLAKGILTLSNTLGTGGAYFRFDKDSNDPQFLNVDLNDSSSPTFIPYEGALTLGGCNWYTFGVGSGALGSSHMTYGGLTSAPSYNPVPHVNSLLATRGYALRFLIYDVPSDSANTAKRYTGVNGNWGVPGNWSPADVPESDRPVVFGADFSPSSINLQDSRSVRGILFRSAGTAQGITLESENTLTIGSSGLRNEDDQTQTLACDVIAGDSQYWMAESGGFLISGNVDTNGRLIVVGGSHEVAFTGTISGSGGLSWDNTSTWEVLPGTAQFTGSLFVQRGTVQLQPGAALMSGTLQFEGEPDATFDLNGNTQTLSQLGGTAGRIAFHTGTLILTSTSSSATGLLLSENGTVDTAFASGTTTLNGKVSGTASLRHLTEGGVLNLGGELDEWSGNLVLGNMSGRTGSVRLSGTALPTGNILFESSSASPTRLELAYSGSTIPNTIEFHRSPAGGQTYVIATGTSSRLFAGAFTTASTSGTGQIAEVRFLAGHQTVELAGINDFTGINDLALAQDGAGSKTTTLRFDTLGLAGASKVSLRTYSGSQSAIQLRAITPDTEISADIDANHTHAGGLSGLVASVGGSHPSGSVLYSGNLIFDSPNLLGSPTQIDLHTEYSGAITEFSGLLEDGGNGVPVTISGNGITRLASPTGNPFTGGVTVESGTLEISNASGSATGTGPVQVNAGGTLRGTGHISGTTTVGGTLHFALHTPPEMHLPLALGGLHFENGAVVEVSIEPGTEPGTYPLAESAGGISGLENATLSLPAGLSGSLEIAGNVLALVLPMQTGLWRLENFGILESTGPAADSADPDSDGFSNLMEYALGLDPSFSDGTGAVSSDVHNGRLRLTFERQANPDITYRVEAGAGLMDEELAEIFQTTGTANVAGTVSVEDTVLIEEAPRRFMRLRVTQP